MKKLFVIILSIVTTIVSNSIKAQNYNVNANQQQININVPVIEKKVYVDRYRTVYVEKPRVARKLDKPVLLLGYLWVYPEDLGNFKQIPVSVINSVNAQNPYGRNNWRIPTPDELAVMEANGDLIGLGDDIYLATDHCNGVLRLVSVEGELVKNGQQVFIEDEYTKCVKVGKTYWMKTNLGANRVGEEGSYVSYEDAIKYCPQGYRLPTKEEYEELLVLGKASFAQVAEKYDAELIFPIMQVATFYMNETYRVRGEYFIQGSDYELYFEKYCDAGYWTTYRPEIQKGGTSKGMVRYVLDR